MDGEVDIGKTGVAEEVLSRTIQVFRGAVATGQLSLAEFESGMDTAIAARSETELGNLVRQLAPPVRITPASRRLPDLVREREPTD